MKEFTVCEGNSATALKNTVNAISPAGSTRADNGMICAQNALESAREGAKKVVIFFTDGTPTSASTFEDSVASSAIATAKEIKAAGSEIYTIGIFSGADPNATATDNGTTKENKFMQAVSSNYPLATYSGQRYYSWNFGTGATNANYYLAASNANELTTVFANIFNSISTTPAGPTHVTDNPQTDGYVTFDDTLGDYMEVKGFEAVVFATQVFKNVTKTTSGNVDTYTFTGTHDSTVSGAYPNAADLSHIIITVTHGSGGTGDHVQVKSVWGLSPCQYAAPAVLSGHKHRWHPDAESKQRPANQCYLLCRS